MIPADPPPLAEGFYAVPAGHLAAVVMALEMRASPAPDETGSGKLALARVPTPDLGWYRGLFRRIGADWLWASRLAWDDAKLAATIHNPLVHVFAAREASDGQDAIGLVELDLREPGVCEIAFFGLVREATGRGLGRAMMTAALRLAWAHEGVERVWLHTCTLDHPAALGFYISCGFTPTRRQVEILADPRLAGHLPRDAARGVPLL